MIDQNARPARKVGIVDHLWDTYEDMALQMGSDRDALINQALFMFARLNGFIEVGSREAAPRSAGIAAGKPPPPILAATPLKTSMASRSEEFSVPPPRPRVVEDRDRDPSSGGFDHDPARREVAERVLETAAELERLIKGKNEAREDAEDDDELPPDDHDDHGHDDSDGDSRGDASGDSEEEGGQLYLMAEGGELDKILKDRFVIGRGKHCDFVINSGKVSREHAVILREGGDYFIEDLGSSNGTWFNKQRIKRRKVEDGDEYFICSEKIKLVVR